MSISVSVVITTYNGEKYIQEQLESIYQQDLQPHEVLIYDDCSKDNTVKIIQNFIKERCLHNWILIQNDVNIGWKENFMRGLLSASGDIVFPCDQDDIWNKNKIRSMVSIMQSKQDILLLSSNYDTFYDDNNENNRVSGSKMKDDGTIIKYKFNSHFMEVKRPGCCFAARKEIIYETMKVWQKELAHDACLWRVSVIKDGLYIYNKKTIRYRRHSSNQTGLNNRKNSNREKISVQINNMLISLTNLEKYMFDNGNDCLGKKEIILDAQKYLTNRKNYLATRSVSKCFANWIRYKKYYPSFKTFLGDLYLIISKA